MRTKRGVKAAPRGRGNFEDTAQQRSREYKYSVNAGKVGSLPMSAQTWANRGSTMTEHLTL